MHDEFMAQLNHKLSARKRQSEASVSQVFTRKQIEQAFIESFELVGGVPRLALWAGEEDNYSDFLQLLIKLAPKDSGREDGGKTFEYRSNVPPSPLNNHAASAPELVRISGGQFEEVEDAECVDQSAGVSGGAGGDASGDSVKVHAAASWREASGS